MKKIWFLLFFYALSFSCPAETLTDLSYKSVFRTFYPLMFDARIQANDYEGHDLPKVGVKSNGIEYLALMHPIQEYKNAVGEDRYLVFIEKREIEKDESEFINGKWVKVRSVFYDFSNTCAACYAEIDFKIFKKLSDGKFKLISSSQSGYKSTSGNGIADINISNLKNKVIKVGENKVGFFYTSSSFSHGLQTTNLNLIVLDENQIKDFYIDVVSSDDSGRYTDETPLSHTLKGEFKLKEDYLVGGYYPIEIKFEGDIYDEKLEKFINYNKIDIFEFSLKENSFKLKSSIDY